MRILFICWANVGRSQMAAAFYNKFTGTHDAMSAGTEHADPRTWDVGGLFQVTSGNAYDLAQDEAFVFKDADPDLQRRVLKLAIFKARLLGKMESYEKVVEIWQRYFELMVDSITKNE